MSKQSKFNDPRPSRGVVPVKAQEIDPTIVTEPGRSDSVAKLYQDFVLGKLDPRQIAGEGMYDDDNAQDVDPMNHFGISLEEQTSIAEAGAKATKEIREVKVKSAAAKAKKAEERLRAEIEDQVRKEMSEKAKEE